MSRMNLIRYGKPTRFDEAPHGSKCTVFDLHSDIHNIYVQINKESGKPNWEHIGEFNKHTHDTYIEELISKRLGT